DYSDETARIIDEEVERILREQEERCRQTLRENQHGLALVARALLEHETIDGEEVKRLIAVRAGQAAPTATGDGDEGDKAGDERAPAGQDARAKEPEPSAAEQALASATRPRPPTPPT